MQNTQFERNDVNENEVLLFLPKQHKYNGVNEVELLSPHIKSKIKEHQFDLDNHNILQMVESIYQLIITHKEMKCTLAEKDEDLKEKNQALRNLKKQAVNYERFSMINGLTSGLLHELRNLLTPISYLELFESKLTQAEEEYIKYILESRNQIINLLDEFKALTKEEEVVLFKEKVELKKIAEDAVKIIKMDASLKDKIIAINIRNNTEIIANKYQMIQVLINLIRNSSHATDHCEWPIIQIDLDKWDDYGIIKVVDNGTGIEDKHLKKIWEPFFSTKGDKGTGVGLDIVKRMVERHEGYICCSSQKDIGTLFTIAIPLAKGQN